MRYIFGIFLIAIGALLFFDMTNLVMIDFWDTIWDWWPLIFVVAGIDNLLKNKHSIFAASFLILIGGLWVASNIGILGFSFWEIFFPLIIITLGLYILFGRGKAPKYSKMEPNGSEAYLNISSFFSGRQERLKNQNIKGGKIEAVFGGIELDLRKASFSEDFDSFNIDALFGGVKLWLPENVKVVSTGSPIFGGIQNSMHTPENEDNLIKINIKYNAVFGGIELIN